MLVYPITMTRNTCRIIISGTRSYSASSVCSNENVLARLLDGEGAPAVSLRIVQIDQRNIIKKWIQEVNISLSDFRSLEALYKTRHFTHSTFKFTYVLFVVLCHLLHQHTRVADCDFYTLQPASGPHEELQLILFPLCLRIPTRRLWQFDH